MENFPHLVNISIESKINQSEEINKVKHAITNLINIELKHENGKIITQLDLDRNLDYTLGSATLEQFSGYGTDKIDCQEEELFELRLGPGFGTHRNIIQLQDSILSRHECLIRGTQ